MSEAINCTNKNETLYTTGEIAKICGVSVRTVQYYDNRGILVPSELTDGGRRLYTNEDLELMKIICFLRNAGISINDISKLLTDINTENVLDTLIQEYELSLKNELSQIEKKIQIIDDLKSGIKQINSITISSIGDIANVFNYRKQLKKIRLTMFITAIPIEICKWLCIASCFAHQIWWPLALYTIIGTVYGVLVSNYYFHNIAYICPECHHVFIPSFKEAFGARHTMTLRKLTCPHCHKKSYCIETYRKDNYGISSTEQL
jgi:DNA-binding transcriptional MerR regulator